MDYRQVNAITEGEVPVLPTIHKIFDGLRGAKVFTTLDLKSAYWQVKLTAASRAKTAFITHKGLFEFTRMPFGLKNAPALFQRAMQELLHEYIGQFVFVTPTTVKQVSSFLGSANYFRSHIQNYARIAEPLNRLLNKKARFVWTKEHDDAFNTLKQALMKAPVMAYPDPNKDYILHTDASEEAMGAVLTQIGDDGKEHVIQYLSKSFPPSSASGLSTSWKAWR